MTDCLIISSHADEYAAEIARHKDVDVSVTACTTSEQALRQYAGQRIVFGDPDLVAPVLPNMPTVEWVQSTWAGVLPFVQGARRDYRLTGIKDVFGEQLSEYVLGYLLAHELKILERVENQLKHQWHEASSGSLQGKRLGIMGTGSIGRHIAHKAALFGMRVSGLSRTGAATEGFDDVQATSELYVFLASVDYLVAILPQTSETDRLLDERAFTQLPSHAYFINIGRGNVVDDDALINALQRGEIAGASLDVFDEEPLPEDSPLWETPNLLITAHMGAVSYPELVVPIFVENYQRFSKNAPLRSMVDFDAGY